MSLHLDLAWAKRRAQRQPSLVKACIPVHAVVTQGNPLRRDDSFVWQGCACFTSSDQVCLRPKTSPKNNTSTPLLNRLAPAQPSLWNAPLEKDFVSNVASTTDLPPGSSAWGRRRKIESFTLSMQSPAFERFQSSTRQSALATETALIRASFAGNLCPVIGTTCLATGMLSYSSLSEWCSST
jgi:hypothetical protein